MAYLNFSECIPTAGAVRDMVADFRLIGPVDNATGLDPRAWTVAHMARRDPMRSLSATPPLGRLRRLLFGTQPVSRLADPRLEVVRRVAVHAWHRGYAIPEAEVAAFLAAGHSLAQLEALVTWIDARR